MQLYTIYQKVANGEANAWVGIHRLPIASAIHTARELRDRGFRVIWRKDGEPGPSYKD